MSTCYSERLKKTLIVRLPGATEAAIDIEMANAAHEFFLESGAWHQIVYANLIAGKSRYELWPDTGSVGVICDLEIEGQPYRPVTGNSVPRQQWNGALQVMTNFGELTLYPASTKTIAKGIVANVTIIPEECGCDIPEDIVNHYYEALLDTALGKLYSHVNRPYSNPNLALFHIGRYRAHLTRARRIVAGGNVRAGGPWVYPQIAPGRNQRGYALPRGV